MNPIKAATLRVLHVYKDFYPPVCGGIEVHVNALAHGLEAKGIDVEVLVCNDKATTDTDNSDGIRVVRVAQLGRFLSAPVSPLFPLWLHRMAEGKDILHFHFPNPTGEIALLLAGVKIPAVVTYHNDIVRQRVTGTLYQPFLTRFLRRVKQIWVTSPQYLTVSKQLQAFRDKCIVVPFGINLAEFVPTQSMSDRSAQIKAQLGGPLILFVGKLRYYKGLPILLRAMCELEAKLLVIGDGPEEASLRRLARELGLEGKVYFEGRVDHSELPAYYRAADVFVLPSTQTAESFGIVLLEAMACGVPVISTELGTGTSYVNQDEVTGLVVPSANASALAAALKRLLADPVLRQRLGAAGRQRVSREFSYERIVLRSIELYESVVAQSQGCDGPEEEQHIIQLQRTSKE